MSFLELVAEASDAGYPTLRFFKGGIPRSLHAWDFRLTFDLLTNRHSLQPASPARPTWLSFMTRVLSPAVQDVFHFPTIRWYVMSSVKLYTGKARGSGPGAGLQAVAKASHTRRRPPPENTIRL